MRTAGFRQAHGQEVHLFDPLSEHERSARWNPLGYVSELPYRCIDDLQRIATMLFPDPLAGDPFWTSSARSLFLGIALYLFETEARRAPWARCFARAWRATPKASRSTGSA